MAASLPPSWLTGGLVLALTLGGCGDGASSQQKPGAPPVDRLPPTSGPTPEPGVASWDSPLRRLTRSELNRTLSAVFGQEVQVASRLPSDESVGPFLANASSPPTQGWVDGWYAVAQEVAAAQAARAAEWAKCDTSLPSCRSEVIGRIGGRAFRRPLLADEQTALLELWGSAATASGEVVGLTRLLEALLMAPDFLFHVEVGAGEPDTATGDVALSNFELGARLAYAVTGGPPDDALLTKLTDGSIQESEALAGEVRRLWQLDQSGERLGEFHRGWLGLYGAELLFKDPALYPQFLTPSAIQGALAEEVPRFASYVLQHGGARVESLFSAPWSFVNEELARIYGLEGVTGTELRPLSLPADQRAGLLTSAAFLAAHGHPDRSNPVGRGVVILRNVLCQSLGDPPEGVDTTLEPVTEGKTQRDRLAGHATQSACAGCHRLIDPLGLAFENYDALGVYREVEYESDTAVDAHVTIAIGDAELDGEYRGALELSRKLGESQRVRACLSQQWLTFLLGRTLRESDQALLSRVTERLVETDRLDQLVLDLTMSRQFRSKSVRQETP
jgi:hypothetical protein